MPDQPRIARIRDIPALHSAGVGYRLVRRELGVRAFGVNGFTADAGELLIEPHDELGASAARHEEAITRLLEAAERDRESVLRWAADDSDLDSLRDDPSFPR